MITSTIMASTITANYWLSLLLLSCPYSLAKPTENEKDKIQTKPNQVTKIGSELASCSGGSNQCIFPFVFNNRIIPSCTTIDGDTTPWCATEVNGDKKMTSWSYCEGSCPGVRAVEMFIHPDNAVGNCACGVPNSLGAIKIVGGYETQTGEYPWQVALLFGSSVRSQGCGGALVGTKYVITAAHCTAGSSAQNIKVLVGDTSLAVENEATSFIVNVATIKQHPDYDSQSTRNDISILELEHPVNLTVHPNIKPICLPISYKTYADQLAVVSGWGTVGSGESLNAHLHEVTVNIYRDGNCADMTGFMTEDMICAGLKAGGKDSCQGDSGGPLFTPDQDNNGAATLVGVVSWGFGCGEEDQLGIYSEVAHFTNWLQDNMEDLNTCPPPTQSTWNPSAHISTSETIKPFGGWATTVTTTTTSTTTSTISSRVSLTGGSSPTEGNVLVAGLPVCDDYWSDTNAEVVCRMLGYSSGVAVSNSYFGSVGSQFAMDDVICSGGELSLLDCYHDNEHDCGESEAAGVRCREEDTATTTHTPDSHQNKVTLVGGSSHAEGNVYINGHPVCDDFWSQNNAIVVCKMLGFVGGAPTVQSYFGAVRTNFGMDNVLCDGTEADIVDCPHDTSHNCGQDEGAGVKCTQVRLMGGHEGNVFINNRPVCDDFWDEADASVVCKMLGFSGGVPKSGSYFGMVSTNYAMDDVFCTGTENSVLDCPHSTTHNCEENEGAGVICNKGLGESAEHGEIDINNNGRFGWIFNLKPKPEQNWEDKPDKNEDEIKDVISGLSDLVPI